MSSSSRIKQVESWDVVVIGAGPSGSAAALMAAQRGLRVLVVDAKRFPRRKVCGGCLNQGSLALAQQLLGSTHPVLVKAPRLDTFQIFHRQRRFSFRTPPGIAIDRAELDAALLGAACQAGAIFRAPLQARLGPIDSKGRQVVLANGPHREFVTSRAVVVATGLGTGAVDQLPRLQLVARANSRIGIEAIVSDFPAEFEPATIHMVIGRIGYVGLTQICGGQLHVAAAVDRSTLQRCGPEQLVTQLMATAGAPQLAENSSRGWRGTPSLTAAAPRVAEERVFLVGDAAGYVEPFTGEGIRWALQSGIGVTECLTEARNGWSPSIASRWESWYRLNIKSSQRLCRRLSWGLQNSWARWIAHQVLSTSPRAADSIIARLNTKVH